MEELKKCPFCGGEAEQIKRESNFPYIYGVWCMGCNCRTSFEKSEEIAIEIWNTRKPVERILERLEEKEKECRERAKEELNEFCLEMFHAYEDEADGIEKAIEIIKEEVGQIEEAHN